MQQQRAPEALPLLSPQVVPQRIALTERFPAPSNHQHPVEVECTPVPPQQTQSDLRVARVFLNVALWAGRTAVALAIWAVRTLPCFGCDWNRGTLVFCLREAKTIEGVRGERSGERVG